jgi:hypothetical protein
MTKKLQLRTETVKALLNVRPLTERNMEPTIGCAHSPGAPELNANIAAGALNPYKWPQCAGE